ncbi:MAG: DUF4013 domain-containing protein [Gammaproteobacteria bacterium]|nr:DUF4013 domain-containing protein [Gammaproteobacteria bacterium]
MIALSAYAFLIIDAVAQGKSKAPSLFDIFSIDSIALLAKYAFAQIILGVVAGVLIALLGKFVLLITVVMIVLYAIFPASALLLATQKNLSSAINPVEIYSLIQNMGSGYLILYGLSIALLSLIVYTPIALFSITDPRTLLVSVSASLSLTTCALSAMAGYAIYQYQLALGYSAIEEDTKKIYNKQLKSQQLIARANAYVIEGRFAEAIEMLAKAAIEQPDNFDIKRRTNALMAHVHHEKLNDYSRQLIIELIEKNQVARACDVFLDTIASDKLFHIDDVNVCFALIEPLYTRGHYKPAINLIVRLAKLQRDFPKLAEAYLTAARIYVEHWALPDKAEPYIKYLLKTPGIDGGIRQAAERLERTLQ